MYQIPIPLVLLLVQQAVSLPAPEEYSGVTNNGAYVVSDASLNANVGGSIAHPAQNEINPQYMVANDPAPNNQVNREPPAYGSAIDAAAPPEVITSTIVVTWTKAGATNPTMAPIGAPVDESHFIEANADVGRPAAEAWATFDSSSSENVISTPHSSSAPLIHASSHYEDAGIPSSGYPSSSSAQVIPAPEPSSRASVTADPDPYPSSNAADDSSDTTTDDDLVPPLTRAPRLPTFTDVPPRFSTLRIESMASQNGLLQTAINGISTILPVIDGLGLLGIETEGTYFNLPGLLDAIDIPCLFRCRTPPSPASPQPGAVPQAPAAVQAPPAVAPPAVAPPAVAPPAAGVPAGAAVMGGGVGAAAGADAGAGLAGANLADGLGGGLSGTVAGGAEAAGGTVAGGVGSGFIRASAEVPPVEAPPAQGIAAQVPEAAGGLSNNPLFSTPGRSLLKGIENGIQNGLDQSGGSPVINNPPSQSLDGQSNDVLSNVGQQPGSDSTLNAPVNGMDNSGGNEMIPPVAASSSAPPQPVYNGLQNDAGSLMYPPPPPMPLNPPQPSYVQDGLQRGINDNTAMAGGLNNGYGNNMGPPAYSPLASPLQNGMNTGMGNNMQQAGNMGQNMPLEAATMNSFASVAHGPPASGQMMQPNAVAGVAMALPVQGNSPSSNGALINAGSYRGFSSMPLIPISSMVTSPSQTPAITPGPSHTPTPTPTPTPTSASSSEPPAVTTTQFNGEVVSCASGKYPDDDHSATPECAGETKVVSTVESIASAYAASVSAEASAAASKSAAEESAAASKSAAEAADASWTSAAAKPSATCDILHDNGRNKVIFRVGGINGWTDGSAFSDTLKKKCEKISFWVTFRIADYLFYGHEKSEFEGRQRDTEKVTFTMSGFRNGCVEDAIQDAGGPVHGKGEGELTCQHKKEDSLPPKNIKDAQEAGENTEDAVFIPLVS
ncbi:hypothetical protein P875_00117072 [Aspergillus parasiticus SU-1]|uniref:Uncharacterized protein n=1 Tax=Aspergillus parasiticus (strain ATCC 56775 / NRRL 5862 / SRRC 143 / SU-1) TaxID=1403190 RepID=A0A0F0INT5_ASPPU|nr:hypothetical protein P875_00117072 [Aspergillus parasiticus SU-1]